MTLKYFWAFAAMTLVGPFLLANFVAAQNYQQFPAYYQVVGVAADDVLNIRAQPRASAPILAALAPNAWPVEVLKSQKNWAYVAAGEGMGWVSMRFLTSITLPKIGRTDLPEGLSCGGTEPFWDLAISSQRVVFSAIDRAKQVLFVTEAGRFRNLGGSTNFLRAESNTGQLTAIVSNQFCSDGMSDRDYPRRVDLLFSTPAGTTGFSGCCNVPLGN